MILSSWPYLRVLLTLVGIVTMADEHLAAPATTRRELRLVAGGGSLTRAYGLQVTAAVPAPPSFADRPGSQNASSCPLEVRAIVQGETSADSFAVLAVGNNSKLVRQGDGFHAGGSLLSVAAIESSGVMVRLGENLVRCDFNR